MCVCVCVHDILKIDFQGLKSVIYICFLIGMSDLQLPHPPKRQWKWNELFIFLLNELKAICKTEEAHVTANYSKHH